MISAKIITIGDEILIGQIIDTNSTFISKELIKIGVEVREILSISDNKKEILEAFQNSVNKYDIFAYENTKRGSYNVYIGRSKVSVTTPLVSYTDINCKETN